MNFPCRIAFTSDPRSDIKSHENNWAWVLLNTRTPTSSIPVVFEVEPPSVAASSPIVTPETSQSTSHLTPFPLRIVQFPHLRNRTTENCLLHYSGEQFLVNPRHYRQRRWIWWWRWCVSCKWWYTSSTILLQLWYIFRCQWRWGQPRSWHFFDVVASVVTCLLPPIPTPIIVTSRNKMLSPLVWIYPSLR